MKKKRNAKMLIPREKRLPNKCITSSMKMYRNMMLFQRDRLNRGEQSAIGLVTSELNIEECLGEFDYHRLADIADFAGAILKRPRVKENVIETKSQESRMEEVANNIGFENESSIKCDQFKPNGMLNLINSSNKEKLMVVEPVMSYDSGLNFEPNSEISTNFVIPQESGQQISGTNSNNSSEKQADVKPFPSSSNDVKQKCRRSLRHFNIKTTYPIEKTETRKRKRKLSLQSNEANIKVGKEDDDVNENTLNDKVSQNKLVKVLNLFCPECPLVLNKRNFNQHLREMHGKLRFRCRAPDCMEQFDDRNLFRQHRKTHLSNTKWTCTECWFEAPNSSYLSSHWNRFHRKGLFQCTNCRANFPYRSEVYNHFYREHSTKVYKYKPVKCEDCGYIARDKSCLKRHQITHTDLKPFECAWDGCGFACNRRCHAIRHVCSIHFGIPQSMKAKERKEKCDLDPNQFVRIVNLR